MIVALRVAKEGFYGGDVERVLNAPADIVLNCIHYIKFLGDYENSYIEINKED